MPDAPLSISRCSTRVSCRVRRRLPCGRRPPPTKYRGRAGHSRTSTPAARRRRRRLRERPAVGTAASSSTRAPTTRRVGWTTSGCFRDVSWARPRDAPGAPRRWVGVRSRRTSRPRAFVPTRRLARTPPCCTAHRSTSSAARRLRRPRRRRCRQRPIVAAPPPSLRWTAMHARGGAAPRPGAGAAALLSSLASPSPASAILLVGGQRSGGRGAMPLWAYRLGRAACAEEGEATPGCYRGHRCDGASGECVCARTGGAPPCKPPPGRRGRCCAWSLVMQAWFLVGERRRRRWAATRHGLRRLRLAAISSDTVASGTARSAARASIDAAA